MGFARASLVTIGFDGEVVAMNMPPGGRDLPADDFGILPPIAPGDRFSGAFTFDNSSPDLRDDSGTFGVYSLDEYPSTRVEFEVNGNTFVLEQPPKPFDSYIQIEADGSDTFLFRWDGRFDSEGEGGFDLLTIAVQALDLEHSFLTTDRLTVVPDFSRASIAKFGYYARVKTIYSPQGFQQSASGFAGLISSMRVLSVVPEPVPEPTPILLLSLLRAYPKTCYCEAVEERVAHPTFCLPHGRRGKDVEGAEVASFG